MHLEWIDENERGKSTRLDTRTRQLIRRRAIQAAALTRQRDRGTSHSSHELKIQTVQPWVILESVQVTTAILPRSLHLTPPAGLLFQQLARSFQDQLSMHDAFFTLLSPSCPPDEYIRFFIALALSDTEYLPAIGSHYGQSECLNAAVDCLTARMQQLLGTSTVHTSTLRLYARALQLLQKAVIRTLFPERFEIYYAIPLLVLFELLMPLDQVAYLTHGRGAVQLLHYIGPDEMKSELNLKILAMQSDIMVIENIRDGQSHCCADPKWKHALLRAVKYDLPPGNARSEANLTLNIIATALPDAFNHVEELIISPTIRADVSVKEELAVVLDGLQEWRQHWEPILRVEPGGGRHDPAQKTVLAICLMYTAVIHRLIVATTTPLEERLSSEHEAFRAANEALAIAAADTFCDIATKTRLAIVTRIGCSVTETSREWRWSSEFTSPNRYINQALFTAWCGRIGRMRTIAALDPSALVPTHPMSSEKMSYSARFK